MLPLRHAVAWMQGARERWKTRRALDQEAVGLRARLGGGLRPCGMSGPAGMLEGVAELLPPPYIVLLADGAAVPVCRSVLCTRPDENGEAGWSRMGRGGASWRRAAACSARNGEVPGFLARSPDTPAVGNGALEHGAAGRQALAVGHVTGNKSRA